jgi:hypothetical protein
MKQVILTILLGYTCVFSHAQQIAAAEYFINSDPGAGNGLPIAVATPGAVVSLTASIPVATLPPGFHLLGIRMRDNTGIWGLYESRRIYISSAINNAANITAAEFFMDADPGVGNGTPVAPIASGSSVSFTANIPTTALAPGFHFLAIRTKDEDGKWGLYESRGFYISSAASNAANIAAGEFFMDADPGVGNGTPVAPITSGSSVIFTANIPTTALAPGFHFLAIRTKDEDGKWGLYESRGFYISSAASNAANIAAAEFFMDTDPGVGNGTPVAPITSGSSVSFTANIPTTALAPGFHFLTIRTRGLDGVWGLYESRGFYISVQSANMPNMVAAEYFLDNDPGIGNGIPISIPVGQQIAQPFSLLVPSGTSSGQHFIAMRFKGADGKWGLYDFDTLTVDGTIPVTGLTLNARKVQNHIAVNWFTLTEINSHHFELERSTNGTQFEKIATMAAAGNSNIRQDYTYIDAQPSNNLNYYRIKQLDRDGRFVYSQVQLVRMNEEKSFSVFPTITTGNITIAGITSPVRLLLYNAAKQLVKVEAANTSSVVLNMQSLSAGNYWLLIELDGKLVHHQVIVKQ